MPSRVSAHRLRGARDTSAPHGGVVEPLGQVGVERVLAGVAAGTVPAVVAQGDGLGERHVEPAGPGDGRGHLGHLEGVGQPGPLVVVGEDEDLGLAGQPAEGGGVQDAVPVALEAGAPRVGLLGRARTTRPRRPGRPGGEAASSSSSSRSLAPAGPGPAGAAPTVRGDSGAIGRRSRHGPGAPVPSSRPSWLPSGRCVPCARPCARPCAPWRRAWAWPPCPTVCPAAVTSGGRPADRRSSAGPS